MVKTLKYAANMKRKKDKTTFGTLALAMFWLVVISGIVLAIPFDVEKPYASVSTILIANPAASLFRNLHYWSAQLFLVFSLVHIYDHFKKKEDIRLKKGLWFRLSIGVLIIFLAMLTGFLLKGDADSLQARRILDNLISVLFKGQSRLGSNIVDQSFGE